jgi:hypothetical protein
MNAINVDMEWLTSAASEEVLEWLESNPSSRTFELSDVGPIVKFLSAFTETKSVVVADQL